MYFWIQIDLSIDKIVLMGVGGIHRGMNTVVKDVLFFCVTVDTF
jgi:hypothetical protein